MNPLKKTYVSLGADAAVALWLAVWWVCNLLQASFSELANDEAYYWIFARELAWGYFDHPPVTALLVRAGGLLFGGELGVRLLFTLLQPLYLWILWRLVRPSDASRRDGELFVLVAAATLMLQLYGFIAVPDGPLLMTAALFLWALRLFADGRRGAWLLLGATMALMAYSKYHGALVVLFALAANPRLLKRPTLYLSGAVTLALLVPHLLWQYHHDWVSLAYHLAGRNGAFRWSHVTDFAANMLVVFNPLFVPLYVQAWRKTRADDAVRRTLRLFPPAFMGFFLLSSLRGYVQPQWTIVAALGLVYLLFDYARRHARTRRYVMRAGWATLAMAALVRLVMIFNPLHIRYEVFDNRASYDTIARIADGRPVIFRDRYSVAAKYAFYTGGETYCQPNLYYRTHQWQLRDDDTRFAGRAAVLETSPRPEGDTLLRTRSVELANGKWFTWTVVDDFRPVRLVDVVCRWPQSVRPGESLRLELRMENPYPYAIEIGGETTLVLVARSRERGIEEFPTEVAATLPTGGSATAEVGFRVPEAWAGTKPEVGFTLRREGYTYWFNGKSRRLRVEKQ